jgi:hypothetical protein
MVCISLVHRLIHSVVHGFFHLISLASQAPFPHSLMHLTTSTTHGFCISKTNVPIGHWFLVVISYFRNFRPGACRARVICFQNPDNMKSQPCKQAWLKKKQRQEYHRVLFSHCTRFPSKVMSRNLRMDVSWCKLPNWRDTTILWPRRTGTYHISDKKWEWRYESATSNNNIENLTAASPPWNWDVNKNPTVHNSDDFSVLRLCW